MRHGFLRRVMDSSAWEEPPDSSSEFGPQSVPAAADSHLGRFNSDRRRVLLCVQGSHRANTIYLGDDVSFI